MVCRSAPAACDGPPFHDACASPGVRMLWFTVAMHFCAMIHGAPTHCAIFFQFATPDAVVSMPLWRVHHESGHVTHARSYCVECRSVPADHGAQQERGGATIIRRPQRPARRRLRPCTSVGHRRRNAAACKMLLSGRLLCMRSELIVVNIYETPAIRQLRR